MNENVVVLRGNVIDGIVVIGPFDSWDSATAWAEEFCDEWTAVAVRAPEDCEFEEDFE